MAKVMTNWYKQKNFIAKITRLIEVSHSELILILSIISLSYSKYLDKQITTFETFK